MCHSAIGIEHKLIHGQWVSFGTSIFIAYKKSCCLFDFQWFLRTLPYIIHFLGNPCALYSVFCLCHIIKVLQKRVPEISVYRATTGLKKIYQGGFLRTPRSPRSNDLETQNNENFLMETYEN